MKKTKYFILKKDGQKEEIEGTVYNNVWGIDKREAGYYVLTYVPNGAFVDSSKKMTILKMLIQEPEFFDFDGTPTTALKLFKAIKRYRDKNGWV